MTSFIFPHRDRNLVLLKNKLEKSVITVNDNKESFNAHTELPSNNKETINIDEKTIKDDIQTNVNKIIVTKKQFLILTMIIPFYKLMLIIMNLLQKTHRNTKIKIKIKKKYQRVRKVEMHH